MINIPNIIFQTSRNKKILSPLVEYYSKKFSSYEYYHFDNNDILTYFNNNPITGFEDIKHKFSQISSGPHKADLIRYYLLYLNGGIYFDTDVEIIDELSNIIQDYAFVGVITNESTAFNGFIACTPKHPIIHRALINIYNHTRQSEYMYFCHRFAEYIKEHITTKKPDEKILILKEHFIPMNRTKITTMESPQDIKMIHHYKYKNTVKNNYLIQPDPIDDVFKR